ncbi:ubiquitin-conjugating enzyme E2 J1 [Capronia epimyces CBS 606.96]|uniref:Ubiquitin-conjugating enzyme E2 J1 n=1 Tax=Capronia epimyces CBS 606.96 TaxID=1182542 RepID=W9XUD8_9EURO|nr:ubiquitin-conjugating enzyme E2 J1 [Capronia epimyces CBS 606.96]EXJ84192.1 ubiquitin-conjugating enzyme E2 J1 [Capronia epimyces CBS 606.96]
MAPSPTMRRLLKETAELSSSSSNPNPSFFAAPVSDSDLHEWHFTLLGPPAPSPYAGGIYHGRITLPTTYPLKPPNFRFLTPSGRFEVNREICLSISGFHEETWMPAWGVRTALTALRSFMAEKGSAGQVGGLESSPEVRMKLAKDSRAWRCDACQKSNETIMREWWEICYKAGVRVQEEDLNLESLPDGMALEARDPKAQSIPEPSEGGAERHLNEKTAQPGTSQVQVPSDSSSTTPLMPPRPSSSTDVLHVDGAYQPHSPCSTLRPASPASLPFVPTPSAEAVQASAEAVLTPSDLALPPPSDDSRARHPMVSSIHAPPVAAANAAVLRTAQPLALQQNGERQREQTITIDRAIAGVFLALCLMVLKKIFYPAGGAGHGGVDEFYLQRE